MKKILFFGILLFVGLMGRSQSTENEELIKLGKAYKDNMFKNEPEKKYLKNLKKGFSKSLEKEADFITETITTDNKLLDKDFLTIPNQNVLKNIFIIRAVNYNFREETDITATELVDSLKEVDIPRYELVDAYYSMLFAGVGNKNKPFNLSKVNLQIDDYQLKNEVEKGIFFLQCMDLCGTHIWGYMNIVDPPNTAEALSFIKRYPKINEQPYYQHTDLYFKDFEMIIEEDKGMESYKTFYLDKYFETLLSHLISLDKEGGTKEEIRDLLLGSILKEEDLYKYTKHKEILESIFQKKERD